MTMIHLRCVDCGGKEVEICRTYTLKQGEHRTIYSCSACDRTFSETQNTPLVYLKTPIAVVVHVLSALTEGMGINAAARLYGVGKNSIYRWQKRLSGMKQTLLLYALTHQFLHQVIEGDELYTRVRKNVAPDESKGWTIVLMDRATRFIWEMGCGRKDRKLFKQAIRQLCRVMKQTDDLTLLTDGERRYGNILFEICHQVLRKGTRGRPKKTLRKGIKVRLKNKGAQAHKKGRKRPKYQAPFPEHPETIQNIATQDIHANHLEAFNTSLRRRCAAYRRRTNMYAKNTIRLQERLDVYWIVHNFVRTHFTTHKVPAVALGILEHGFSLHEIFWIQKIA
jgi:transposase-like protein